MALLRAQRSHEQAYQRACRALLKMRAALVAARLRPAGPVVRQEKLLAVQIPIGCRGDGDAQTLCQAFRDNDSPIA